MSNPIVEDLMASAREVVVSKALENARVVSKTNERGELVVAIIVPPKYEGQWSRW